jgi:hypothetical protein
MKKKIKEILGEVLCWIGIHSWVCSYIEDGKGNSCDYRTCTRCHKDILITL